MDPLARLTLAHYGWTFGQLASPPLRLSQQNDRAGKRHSGLRSPPFFGEPAVRLEPVLSLSDVVEIRRSGGNPLCGSLTELRMNPVLLAPQKF